MTEKISFKTMLYHLNRIEAEYGDGILNKPTAQLMLMFTPEYRAEFDEIRAYGRQFRGDGGLIDDRQLHAIKWWMKQGMFAKEIAPKVELDYRKLELLMDRRSDLRSLYREMQPLRRKREHEERMFQRERIGQRVKKIRERLGMSREEFAKALGCKADTPYRWEAGQRMPGNKYLHRIAQLGRTTVGRLIEEDA